MSARWVIAAYGSQGRFVTILANSLAALLCLSALTARAQAECEAKPVEVVPDHLASLYGQQPMLTPGKAQDNLWAGSRLWENGRTLRVCFYNANPVVSHLIRTVASEWNEYSGVVLDFGKEGDWLNCLSPKVGFAQIRIGFRDRGYWSLVGTHSEQYGEEVAPSMNFDSFNRKYREPKYTQNDVVQKASSEDKATIRHEFGHALGLLHEHQNPELNCFGDMKRTGEGNVYQKLGAPPYCWEKDQVDTNLGFISAADPDFVAGKADVASVMMYSLPPDFFIGGTKSKCVVATNLEISEQDKAGISKLYPKQSSSQTIVAVSETITDAKIRPASALVNADNASDYIDRVVADLESDDTATRRNARARLSRILAQNTATAPVNALLEAMPAGSFRYQLGVAVAIGSVPGTIKVSPAAAKALANALTQRDAKREPLKGNLERVRQKIVVG